MSTPNRTPRANRETRTNHRTTRNAINRAVALLLLCAFLVSGCRTPVGERQNGSGGSAYAAGSGGVPDMQTPDEQPSNVPGEANNTNNTNTANAPDAPDEPNDPTEPAETPDAPDEPDTTEPPEELNTIVTITISAAGDCTLGSDHGRSGGFL